MGYKYDYKEVSKGEEYSESEKLSKSALTPVFGAGVSYTLNDKYEVKLSYTTGTTKFKIEDTTLKVKVNNVNLGANYLF